MRRIIKSDNSSIVSGSLTYKSGNSLNNTKISKALFKEQKGFCAYTEEYLGRADARDVEHFNPALKNTGNDGYRNWFLVKHQWNTEKSTKWLEPILHPTDLTFENRIIYDNGDYRVNDSNDEEAVNLIKLIKLDDLILANQRKRYIKRKKDEIEKYGQSPKEFFKVLIDNNLEQISYLRAIKEEFELDIWEILPEPT